MNRWQSRVAVVTGASSGIGTATVNALLEHGMIVVGLARRIEQMENEFKVNLPAEQKSRFHPLKCDVSKEDNIKECFAWVEQNLGGVDVLINNAGIGIVKQIVSEDNSELLRSVLHVNVLAMKNRNCEGHVIWINSYYGHRIHLPGGSLNIYCPSKFAVTAITEMLRQEFTMEGTKVIVTNIGPGLRILKLLVIEVLHLPICQHENLTISPMK